MELSYVVRVLGGFAEVEEFRSFDESRACSMKLSRAGITNFHFEDSSEIREALSSGKYEEFDGVVFRWTPRNDGSFAAEIDKGSVRLSSSSSAVSGPNLIANLILFPFKLAWNILVTGLIIGGFILWFSFIFGSVLGVILILIFAPSLFLLPLELSPMYVQLWND